jgi:hypothetical protein
MLSHGLPTAPDASCARIPEPIWNGSNTGLTQAAPLKPVGTFVVSITSSLVHIRLPGKSTWHASVKPSTPWSPVNVALVNPTSWKRAEGLVGGALVTSTASGSFVTSTFPVTSSGSLTTSTSETGGAAPE